MIEFDPAALRGRFVYLLPLRMEDKEILRPLARDERIWEFTKTPTSTIALTRNCVVM